LHSAFGKLTFFLLLAGISREVSIILQTQSMGTARADEQAQTGAIMPDEATHLRQLTRQQWRSGIAAWLGWTFDGLDMHLYTLVAAPFVAQLLGAASTTDPRVGRYGSIIQGGFMLGWALGGGLFGRIGDRLGRARALSLTVLTYAAFTGLSFFAQTWWHLLIFRFLAALGIGGEWAVGASLLSETWPRRWRPWIAAVLQTGVNVGILGAGLANVILAAAPPRCLFLVGVLPALLVFWIRRAVPETEEWRAAKAQAHHHEPGIGDLFRGEVLGITLRVVLVCGVSLTAHWAFMFWHQQHLRNLPDVLNWSDEQKNKLASVGMYLVIASSILGNFFAGWLARLIGYRTTIAGMFLIYFFAMFGAYYIPRNHVALLCWFPLIGFCQGAFALFTMYLPPLFPTLLRTTGAGFCYNIGRITAAFGTVFFGLFSNFGDHRIALFYAGFLFLPAAFISLFLPRLRD
jgi:MFS family permease